MNSFFPLYDLHRTTRFEDRILIYLLEADDFPDSKLERLHEKLISTEDPKNCKSTIKHLTRLAEKRPDIQFDRFFETFFFSQKR